ncbi:hypothetical protein [Streptomyces sp. NBC_01276]|uniref:hypothetical protein n=1 Tax=Streptomyces sp. NBC_01276 TaxID=2903808 RepID=UPI00352CDA0F
MSETVVVYEYPSGDSPPGDAASGDERLPLRVHAAPAAPGRTSVRGPRTLCGRDTFAMETAPWRPAEHPDAPWYPPRYADRVCPACDDAAGEG